jgi:flagellar hook-length control protein FliK
MNATNRPVDFLLNLDVSKTTQSSPRASDRNGGVSALKQKENSFDQVYRQQRRDDLASRQSDAKKEPVARQNQPAERAAESPRSNQSAAVKTKREADNKSVDGKALPPGETAKAGKADRETSAAETAALNTESVAAPGVDDDIEQLELGLSTDNQAGVEGEQDSDQEMTDEGLVTGAVDAAETAVNSQAKASATDASMPDMLKALKQNRAGEIAGEGGQADVNKGASAKPVAGSPMEQGGQNLLQDRFTQMPLGQDLKILREQVKNTVVTDTAKVATTDAAKAADGGDPLTRLNGLTQAAQSLGQARPGTVTASVQAPVGSADWGQAVSQRIAWLVNRGISSAELQLNPRELGPVDVRINLSGDQATVQFTSQHAAVRDALESSVARLREMLENNGLDLANVDVSDQSASQQEGADTRDGAVAGVFDKTDEAVETTEAQTVQRIETDSLIDLHA